MYCPQCGQQQVSDITRFCSRCGFLLEAVSGVLASGGVLPVRQMPGGPSQLSPRNRGVRQGALMMLSTILLVPLMSIISVFIVGMPEVLIPLTAITCFVGGLFRILYALLMEDATPAVNLDTAAGYAPAPQQFDRPPRQVALPSPPGSTASWRPGPNTAEIYQSPPSITENTTRLLDKDEKPNR